MFSSVPLNHHASISQSPWPEEPAQWRGRRRLRREPFVAQRAARSDRDPSQLRRRTQRVQIEWYGRVLRVCTMWSAVLVLGGALLIIILIVVNDSGVYLPVQCLPFAVMRTTT